MKLNEWFSTLEVLRRLKPAKSCINHFKISRKHQHKLHSEQFCRAKDHFAKFGTLITKPRIKSSFKVISDDNVEIIQRYFRENPHASITKKNLDENIFPKIKTRAMRNRWWFQQNSPQTVANLEMLQARFRGPGISRRATVSWPSCSPDLNHLAFRF